MSLVEGQRYWVPSAEVREMLRLHDVTERQSSKKERMCNRNCPWTYNMRMLYHQNNSYRVHRCLMFLFGLRFHNTITCWLENFWAPRVSSILAFLIGIKQRREWGLPKAREIHRILYFHYSVTLTCWTVFSLNGIPMNDSLIFLWPFQIPRDDLKDEKTTNNRCLNKKFNLFAHLARLFAPLPEKSDVWCPPGGHHTHIHIHTLHIYIYTPDTSPFNQHIRD